MGEPAQIDHKDEPGTYRDLVRAGVFSRVGSLGEPVVSPEQLAGDWDVAFVSFGSAPQPMYVYQLRTNGMAAIEYVGLPVPPSTDEWRLNPDGTFSLFTLCPADPEIGTEEPCLEEDRRHIAALVDGRIVMWNGDGSLVLLLTRRTGLPHA